MLSRLKLPAPLPALALLAVATLWLCCSLPLVAQEAYYWTYAQHPDLSYFDHPPMVAWLIWLGTQCFGDGSLGVRLGTWLCGLTATWLGLQLLVDFGVDERGQTAWVALGILSPIVTMTHFLANPDAPLVAAWTLTLWALWRARGGKVGWWVLAGLGAGLALTSKYSAAFLGLGGMLLLLADGAMRRQLRTAKPWLAVLVAALVFMPVVAWNWQHDFESFRFQSTERLSRGQLGLRWFGQFVGGQLLVLHPALAVAMPLSIWFLLRRVRTDARALHLLVFGLPMVGYLLVQSLWIQVKINWLAPSYVALLLGVVWWWREGNHGQWLHSRAARWLMASLALVPMLLPFAPALRVIPSGRGSSWTGWQQIAESAERWEECLDTKDQIEGNTFFFAADYRDAAQLGRNLQLLWEETAHHNDGAAGEPTLAQNVFGLRALQFDHWAQPEHCIGQDAVFVLPRPVGREAMVRQAAACFARMELVEHVAIAPLGIDLVQADIYCCYGYKGPEQPR